MLRKRPGPMNDTPEFEYVGEVDEEEHAKHIAQFYTTEAPKYKEVGEAAAEQKKAALQAPKKIKPRTIKRNM